MATSGDISLTFTRDEIIQEAYEHLHVVEPGVAASAAQVTSAARTLNNMIKAWQTKGLVVHSVRRSYLFPTVGEYEYTLNSGIDRWVETYRETTVAVAAASGVVTITVANAAFIANGDEIGIYQDDGTMHWATVNGAPVGNVVTLDAVTTDTVSVGAVVYFYDESTDGAERPLEIVEMWEHNVDGNDRPIDLVSRQEYSELTLKSNTGALVSAFYDPQVGNDNLLHIWPATSDPRNFIGAWVKRTVESFTAAADEVDLPQESFEAVAFNLAKRLISKTGVDQFAANYVLAMAGSTETELFDSIAGPEASVEFQPDFESS